MIQLIVENRASGQRLDVFLFHQKICPSRTQTSRLISEGNVTVNGKVSLKPGLKVWEGDVIQYNLPEVVPAQLKPENIPLDILFEDEDLLVLNKPAGLVCHPGAGQNQGTLVNALLFHCKGLSTIGGHERPGLVHRLDKETSGTLVVAKNDLTHQGLAAQFKEHSTMRTYWAIVVGSPKKKIGTITSHLSRHPVHRKRFASSTVGKLAITHYEVIATYPKNLSLLHVKLETGRTHQIRVHLSEMGHPVAGDSVYGEKILSRWPDNLASAKSLGRHALHAAELGFTHPRKKTDMLFKVDWPQDLRSLLEKIGAK